VALCQCGVVSGWAPYYLLCRYAVDLSVHGILGLAVI